MKQRVARRAAAAPPPRLAARLAALRGWRRFGLALALGLLSATAFAPLWLLPALVPAFVGLLWLLQGAGRGRGAFVIGWAFGFGHFLGSFYWVGIAMTVDFARFWWFLPISVGGLAAGMALYIAIAAWIVWQSRWQGAARLLLLAAVWLLMEWFRAWVLSGFSWNQLGAVWTFAPETMQLASLTGIWGLSLLTLLAAGAPALFAEPTIGRREAWATLAVAWGLLLAALVFGIARLAAAPPSGEPAVPGVGLRLVQPSVEQTLKWRPELRARHVERLIELTQTAADTLPITHVVWPETAVPYNLWQDDALRQILAGLVPTGGLLITGAPRYEQGVGSWNSLYALDATGSIVAYYDKAHLVPFGEYVPLQALLGRLNLTVTQGSFLAGPGLQTLALPGLPAASPLICYEVIFAGEVVAADAPRPGFLLNITNDAWFGQSSGPFQHFAQARLRAVEEGLPLVRAANNGISAVVDPYGRVVASLGLNEVGVLDSALPSALEGETLFAQLSAWLLVPLVLVPVMVALLLVRRNVAGRVRGRS